MAVAETAGGVLLVLSHLILVPLIVYSINHWLIFVTGHSILVLIFSTVYHTCRAFNACSAFLPLQSATQLDYIWALSFIVVDLLVVTSTAPDLKYAAVGGYKRVFGKKIPIGYLELEMFANIVLYQVLMGYVIFVVIAFGGQPNAALFMGLLVFVGAVLGVLLKVVFVHGSLMLFQKRFRYPWFIAGVVLILLSLVFFPVEGDWYSWAHLGWHAFVFFGQLCFFIGITRRPGYARAEIKKFITDYYKPDKDYQADKVL